MRVLIRTDAGHDIGSGHLMRCLTLADELARRGHVVALASCPLPASLAAVATERGHALHVLPAGLHGERADAEATLARCGHGYDWLVVDHYQLGAVWESAARPSARRLMAIDDLARPHVADLLLDQNVLPNGPARYQGRVPADCALLLGPRYALLRPDFIAARADLPSHKGPLRRALVFYGGIDAGNETAKALAALSQPAFTGLAVDIVLGGDNPHRANLQARYAGHAGWQFHVQTKAMAELMARADLYIGAGGTVQLERLCLGLPGIVTAVADNQVESCAWLGQAGLVDYLGESARVDEAGLAAAITAWQGASAAQWLAMSRKLLDVEAGGCHRVVDAMEAGLR